MATPDIQKLDISDSDNEDLFASPSRPSRTAQKADNRNGPAMRESKYDAEQAHEVALQKELESVRSINEVIEGVVSSLETAKGNMETVSRTVTSASTLLNTWIRMLSQTEHNQRLILNPSWQGATQDMADIENEAILKAQAAERKAAEEERRREEARRRADEEERQRQAGTTGRGARGSRGRVSGLGRTPSVRGSGYGASISGMGRGGAQTPSRGGSGIGRGIGSTRGRARGVR
ncbi:hypothetical protein B7463_g969, partial [Scytalidium lignicola]